MAFKFTQGQSQAIHESGHDILVSASAGSGKTRVLVERVVDKIKHGIDVDRLLILTFTEAAAKEMKERIQKALREACNQTEDEHQKGFLPQIHPKLLLQSILGSVFSTFDRSDRKKTAERRRLKRSA